MSNSIKNRDLIFIDFDKKININGYNISGPLFISSSKENIGSDIINLDLEINKNSFDNVGMGIPNFPSYFLLSPSSRNTYLKWLSSNRLEEKISVKYAYLYLYTIERYIFSKNVSADNIDRAILIIQDLALKFGKYDQKFFRSCYSLIETTYFYFNKYLQYNPNKINQLFSNTYVPILYFIGNKISDSTINSNDLIVYIMDVLGTRKNLPLSIFENLDEFCLYWKYVCYENNLLSNIGYMKKNNFSYVYNSLSGDNSLFGDFSLKVECKRFLPDIFSNEELNKSLLYHFNNCVQNIVGVFDIIKKFPESRESIFSKFINEKFEKQHIDEKKEEKNIISNMFSPILDSVLFLLDGRQVKEVNTKDFIERIIKKNGGISLLDGASKLLDKVDYGFEPDRLYGSKYNELFEKIILFKKEKSEDVIIENHTRLFLEVCSKIYMRNWRVWLPNVIEKIISISSKNYLKSRLVSYQLWLLNNKNENRSILNRVSRLNNNEKHIFQKYLEEIVYCDTNKFSSESLKFIDFINSRIKTVEVLKEEYPIVIQKEKPLNNIQIPVNSKIVSSKQIDKYDFFKKRHEEIQKNSSFKIDINLEEINKIKSETHDVSNLLSTIFKEEDISEMNNLVPKFNGLEDKYYIILDKLIKFDMSYEEFSNFSRSLGFSPEGVIEKINDWSFDIFDEAILEENDILHIEDRIKIELNKMLLEK